jgi:anti-sigma B factor antagonist
MTSQDVAGSRDPAETRTAKIKTTASGGWHATVALYGDIDIAAAPALRTELGRHLDAGRWFIRIDAAGVSFLDSTALNALVSGADRCADARGALILTNVPTRVRQIIQMTGLDTVLLIDTAWDGQARHLADRFGLLDAATHSEPPQPRGARRPHLGGEAVRSQRRSLRCPQCGQAATMTLNEAETSGSTHLIELTCSNAEPHEQYPSSELLNLWMALSD